MEFLSNLDSYESYLRFFSDIEVFRTLMHYDRRISDLRFRFYPLRPAAKRIR